MTQRRKKARCPMVTHTYRKSDWAMQRDPDTCDFIAVNSWRNERIFIAPANTLVRDASKIWMNMIESGELPATTVEERRARVQAQPMAVYRRGGKWVAEWDDGTIQEIAGLDSGLAGMFK